MLTKFPERSSLFRSRWKFPSCFLCHQVRRCGAQCEVTQRLRATAKHLQGGAALTDAYSVHKAHERVREGDAQRWKAKLRDPHDLAPTPLLSTPRFIMFICVVRMNITDVACGFRAASLRSCHGKSSDDCFEPGPCVRSECAVVLTTRFHSLSVQWIGINTDFRCWNILLLVM